MTKQSIHDFYTRLAGDGTVGAGSAAAVSGLMGVGTLQRTAGNMKQKAAAKQLAAIAAELEECVTADAEAMEKFMPFLMTVEMDTDSGIVNENLEQLSIPLQRIMEAGLKALKIAARLASTADVVNLYDIRVGAMTCHTSVCSAIMLWEMNIMCMDCTSAQEDRYLKKLDTKQTLAGKLLDEVIFTIAVEE